MADACACDRTIEVTPPASREVDVTQPAVREVTIDQPGVREVDVTQPGTRTVEVDQPAVREVLVGACRCPAPAVRSVWVAFAHDTPSPLFIAEQATNELITEVVVSVETEFDDGSATLALGTAATPGDIFDTTVLKPAKTDWQAISHQKRQAATRTTIQLAIAPAASNQGGGHVWLKLERI